MLRIVCLALALLVSLPLHAQEPNNVADAERLIELLQLHDGSRVADVGAGGGALSLGVAPHVGAAGRVYATDVSPERLQALKVLAADAPLKNIEVVQGGLSQTNLLVGCCDGIFMRDVYHHFADPKTMNASLLQSLASNGALVVIDFEPRSKRTAPPGSRDNGRDHGIMPADVLRELTEAGFSDVHQVPWPSAGYYAVVAKRP